MPRKRLGLGCHGSCGGETHLFLSNWRVEWTMGQHADSHFSGSPRELVWYHHGCRCQARRLAGVQEAVMAALRSYWPHVSATIQVASPLIYGAVLAAQTRRGALTGRWRWVPLFTLFPLIWARGPTIPGPAVWAVPMACWLAALISIRSHHRALHAAILFATGATTATLQLWHLSR
jgi:hypothetical protein